MLPTSLAGVFSRFFISGFFIPVLFTLLALWLTGSSHLQVGSLDEQSQQTAILVLAGIAVLVALLLQGLRFPIIQIFEGYPLKNSRFLRPLAAAAVALQRRSYRQLVQRAGDEKWRADWLVDRRFPREESRLLPTRFGNTFRAEEDYAYTRWGLDTIAIYPRIDALLTEREQELHWNAYADVMLFINLSLGSFVVGVVLVGDEIAHDRLHGWAQLVYLVPFLVANLVYRFAIGAARRLGTERRASIDLHRLELYKLLGVREPLTSAEESERIAPAVNELLLYGISLPDDVRWPRAEEEDAPGEPRAQPRSHPREDSPGEPRPPLEPREPPEPEPAPQPPPAPPMEPEPDRYEESPGEPREPRAR
jgi:hypothetical protein